MKATTRLIFYIGADNFGRVSYLNHWRKSLMLIPAKKCTTRISFHNQAVNESCYAGDDSVLKSLVEIADTAPKYLRPNLEATLQLSLKVNAYIFLTSRNFLLWMHQLYITFKCAWWFLETARLCWFLRFCLTGTYLSLRFNAWKLPVSCTFHSPVAETSFH